MATSKKESVLRKVRALLSQAEDSAATPEEAEAFSAKAEQLIATYAIDLAMLDARNTKNRGKPATMRVPMVAPYKIPKAGLLSGIASAYGVRLVTHGRSHMTLVGFQSDLDAVDLLYTSLLLQASNALRLARKTSGKGGEDLVRFSASFIDGFGSVVGQRLRETRNSTVEGKGEKAALVLRDRSDEVDEALNELFPQGLTKGRGRRISDYGAYGQGGTAGRSADLGGNSVGGHRQAIA